MLFKNKYGEPRSGVSIALMFVFFLAAQLITFYVVIMAVSASEQDFVAGLWINVLVQLMVIGALLLAFKTVYKLPFRIMGLVKEGWFKELLAGCAFGIVSIAAVFVVLTVFGQADISYIGFNANNTAIILWSFVHFIGVGFSEEIMTRGYIMTALKTTRNKHIAFFAPAFVFSLLHLGNDNVSALGLINIGLVGVLFAYMMVRSGKLWLPIGFHIAWNFFQGNIFGMNVSGGATPSIIATKFTGPDWITGGAFGAEGGIVTTVVIALGFLFVRHVIKKPETPAWTFESDLPFSLVTGR